MRLRRWCSRALLLFIHTFLILLWPNYIRLQSNTEKQDDFDLCWKRETRYI